MLPIRFVKPMRTVGFERFERPFSHQYLLLNDEELLVVDDSNLRGNRTVQLRVLHVWTLAQRIISEMPQIKRGTLRILKCDDNQSVLMAYLTDWTPNSSFNIQTFMVVSLKPNVSCAGAAIGQFAVPQYAVSSSFHIPLQLIESPNFHFVFSRLLSNGTAIIGNVDERARYQTTSEIYHNIPNTSTTFRFQFYVQQRLCLIGNISESRNFDGDFNEMEFRLETLFVINTIDECCKQIKISLDKYWGLPKGDRCSEMQPRSEQELLILCSNGKCPLHLALWRLCLKDIDKPRWSKMAVVSRPDPNEFQLMTFGVDQMLTVVYQRNTTGATHIEQFALQPLKLRRLAQLALNKPAEIWKETDAKWPIVFWWLCFTFAILSLFY